MIHRIALMTGDEDAPGMNAVIRGATRMALDYGWQVMGVFDNDKGGLAVELIPLTAHTVDGIIQWGGTLLGKIDSEPFLTEYGQKLALDYFAESNIDALIVVGGEQAQTGAYALAKAGFPVNGVTASVENELASFDISIGVDTAMNVALDTIDCLKTARSDHSTTFVVEVAGRRCGYLAIVSSIVGRAEAIVIPEVETTPEQIADLIKTAHEAGSLHPLVVVAEGAVCNAYQLGRYFSKDNKLGRKTEQTSLGYLQRHAAPNAFDRMLGTRLGAYAVDMLAHGAQGVLAGLRHGEMATTPFAEVIGKTRELDPDLLRLTKVLSIGTCTAVQVL